MVPYKEVSYFQLEELVDLPTKSTDELEQLQDRLRCLDEDKIRF